MDRIQEQIACKTFFLKDERVSYSYIRFLDSFNLDQKVTFHCSDLVFLQPDRLLESERSLREVLDGGGIAEAGDVALGDDREVVAGSALVRNICRFEKVRIWESKLD